MRMLTALTLLAAVAGSSGYGVRWANEKKPADGLELSDVLLTDGEWSRSGKVITLKSETKDGPTYYAHEQATPRSQRLNMYGTFRGERVSMVVEFDH